MPEPELDQEVTLASPSPPAPPPSPASSLTDQYELEDSSFDPQLDAPPAPAASLLPQPVTAPAPAPHPVRLLRLATELGIPADEAATLSTAQLREEVRDLQMHAFLTAQNNRRSSSATAAGAASATAPAAPLPEAIDWGQGTDGQPLTEQDYLPPVAAGIKSTHELKARLAQLEAVQARHQQQQQTSAQQALNERLDRCFVGRPGFYGAGPASQLSAASTEALRRLATLEIMKRLPAGTVEERYARAEEIQFGIKPAAAGELTPAQQRWLEGGQAKPTQRLGAKEPKGPGRAMKAVYEKMRAKGIDTEDDFGSAEEAGLPD